MCEKLINVLKVTAVTALVFLGVSCASEGNVSGSSKKADLNTSPAAIDIAAARSAAEAFGSGVWITRPRDSSITVIGIAGRLRNRDDTIAEALADAARKVSLYHGVYGEATSVVNQGTGLLEYYANTEYNLYLLSDPASYIDSLVFDKETDVLEKEGSLYVRTRFSGVADVPSYFSTVNNGGPSWASAYSVYIPGYRTSVGVSKNKGSLQKTYQASYELAVVSLLSQISSQVEDTSFDIAGGGRVTGSTTVSKGWLSGIMILETWFDQKDHSVWTLAAVKED